MKGLAVFVGVSVARACLLRLDEVPQRRGYSIHVKVVLAQAVLEKGMLDSMILGISNFVIEIRNLVDAHLYLTIGAGAIVLLFLLKRRR